MTEFSQKSAELSNCNN